VYTTESDHERDRAFKITQRIFIYIVEDMFIFGSRELTIIKEKTFKTN
jgi:hypothetical protein